MLVADRAARHGLLLVLTRLAPSHLAQHPVREAQLAVGSGTDAKVVAKLPVVQVVAATVPGSRIGTHLVALPAAGGGACTEQVEHLAGQVHVRQFGRPARKRGVGLQRQLVERKMRRRQRLQPIEFLRQPLQGLTRQRVHQVDIEGVEGGAGLLDGGLRLIGVVHPPQGPQRRVGKTLHPHRQAGDARRAIAAEAVAFEGAGIGLERDLAARFQRQASPQIAEQGRNGFGREQAGGTPTDEHGHHRPPPDQRQGGLQVGTQRVDIGLRALGVDPLRGLVAVEVAIRAFAQAPGQVHVQRQGRQRRQLQRALAHQGGKERRAHQCQRSCNCATSCRMASARWLWAFFSASVSVATEPALAPRGRTMGS